MANKIKKSIRFTEESTSLIESYRQTTGEDFSNATESLVIRGLENFNSAKMLQKKVDLSINNLIESNKKFENRVSNLLVGIARIQGKIHALTVVNGLRNSTFNKDELRELENQGIQKAMDELKTSIESFLQEAQH